MDTKQAYMSLLFSYCLNKKIKNKRTIQGGFFFFLFLNWENGPSAEKAQDRATGLGGRTSTAVEKTGKGNQNDSPNSVTA